MGLFQRNLKLVHPPFRLDLKLWLSGRSDLRGLPTPAADAALKQTARRSKY
jgi:hypothetical protein